MTIFELARLIQRMRDAQRHYFRTRSLEALDDSKRLERELDHAARVILEDRPPMLPGLDTPEDTDQ